MPSDSSNNAGSLCVVHGCGRRKAGSRLYCGMHKQRAHKYGSTELPIRPNIVERFWRLVEPVPTEVGCWLWRGSMNNKGYGVFGDGREGSRLAHRFSWTLRNGPIADGAQICHRCDVPLCVNPDHHFVCDQGQNVRDAVQKGRHYSYFRLHGTKLTDEDVVVIRNRYAGGGVTMKEIAETFAVSPACVQRIVRGLSRKAVA